MWAQGPNQVPGIRIFVGEAQGNFVRTSSGDEHTYQGEGTTVLEEK